MTDPFQTLGVSRTASDAELRAAYRRLVQLHHPAHNGGSAESARRFEEVQEAYAQARRLRQSRGRAAGSSARAGGRTASGSTPRSASRPTSGSRPREDDSDIGSRLTAMEAELRAARDEAVRQARRARQAAARAQDQRERASDEELGYISTDDSFSKILSDAASGIGERLTEVQKEARDSPVTKRFADLIDELGSKLTGEPPDRR
jgi:curved DNA-binding protein CbpA